MTKTSGYYNDEKWPIQLVISKLNVTLNIKPGEFILGRDGRKINDPYFEVFTGHGLSREVSDVPVPINNIPPATSERRETTSISGSIRYSIEPSIAIPPRCSL